MNIDQAFPSKYLKAADLEGRAHVLTIDRCVTEDVGREGAPEHAPVLYFKEAAKGVRLNKTNAGTVSYLYGSETDAWAGKQIEVFPDTVMFNNAMVPCIRLRQHVAPAGVAAAPLGGASAPLPTGTGTLATPIGESTHDERNPPDDDEIPF